MAMKWAKMDAKQSMRQHRKIGFFSVRKDPDPSARVLFKYIDALPVPIFFLDTPAFKGNHQTAGSVPTPRVILRLRMVLM